jgi:hypothetical protein
MPTEHVACEFKGCREGAKWHIRSRNWPDKLDLQHNVCNKHLGDVAEVLMEDAETPYDIMLRSQLPKKRRRRRKKDA